jgi:hypothetical protein
MKMLFFFTFFLVFINVYGQKQMEITPSDIANAPVAKAAPATVVIPENYEDLVNKAPFNTMEKKINLIIGESVRKNRVVIEQVNDFIYLQVIPNYAYFGDNGEEKLAEDLMEILNSGKISAPAGAQFMNISYAEMLEMNLPFKKKLTDSMILGKEKLTGSIDLTFFVNVNVVSNRLFNSLENIKEFKAVYNSTEKYYRTRYEGSRFLYLIRIPNLIYEIIFTGDLYETIVAKYVRESLFISGVLKKYEKGVTENKKLEFDGRYIKGEGVIVDLWFLPERTNLKEEKAEEIFRKILKGDKVEVVGSQKG